MKSVKEIALEVVAQMQTGYPPKLKGEEDIIEFAERLLAAIAEQSAPVAKIEAANEQIPYPHLVRLVDVGTLPIGAKLYLHPPRSTQNANEKHGCHGGERSTLPQSTPVAWQITTINNSFPAPHEHTVVWVEHDFEYFKSNRAKCLQLVDVKPLYLHPPRPDNWRQVAEQAKDALINAEAELYHRHEWLEDALAALNKLLEQK